MVLEGLMYLLLRTVHRTLELCSIKETDSFQTWSRILMSSSFRTVAMTDWKHPSVMMTKDFLNSLHKTFLSERHHIAFQIANLTRSTNHITLYVLMLKKLLNTNIFEIQVTYEFSENIRTKITL